jgi:hypothetical protein
MIPWFGNILKRRTEFDNRIAPDTSMLYPQQGVKGHFVCNTASWRWVEKTSNKLHSRPKCVGDGKVILMIARNVSKIIFMTYKEAASEAALQESSC